MDPDVLELVRAERLVEAARLCRERGDTKNAIALFERACDWASASTEAVRAGECLRGLELALRAGDEGLAEAAASQLARDPDAAERAATYLRRLGQHRWAARILEGAVRLVDAAGAWERAGHPTRAGQLFERAGQPARAVRAFEAALRMNPRDAIAALALGSLLVRFGKDEAGIRFLQRVGAQTAERREALEKMTGAFERLGLQTAAREAAAELGALGGSLPEAEPSRETERAVFEHRYEVLSQVGSSPRARLLEGVDRVRGERVAIKVFAPAAAGAGVDRRLERDVRAIRALGHPTIVPIVDFYEAVPVVVFAWMDGGSLDPLLAAGALAPARAVEITCAVLDALGAAHRAGVLHRAVKPANVLFNSAGAALLSDFGAAYANDASTTATADEVDDAPFTSPEQREGRDATTRSDVFGAGVLLYTMLTGTRPRVPYTPPSAILSNLTSRHDAVVARMMAPAAEQRPADPVDARRLIISLTWPPSRGERRADRDIAAASVGPAPPAHIEADRLEPQGDGSLTDRWTGYRVERVSLSDATLARARAFARVGHGPLQTVLCVDRETESIWLVSPAAPLCRPLTAAERVRLQGALDAVHEAGEAHVPLEDARVAVDAQGDVVLCLSNEAPSDRR